MDETHLFYVVARDQANGLVIVLCSSLLFRLPPVILGALLEHIQDIARRNCKLAFAMGSVVVYGFINAHEPHLALSGKRLRLGIL